jgi:O-antigen/teichoic acid export membrane protein
MLLPARLLGNPLVLFAAAYALSAAIQKGAGFVILLWLGHVLSVEDFARLGLLMALQAGITALASAGVVEAVIGRLRNHRTPEDRGELHRAANIIFMVLATMVGVGAVLIYVAIVRNVAWSWIELGAVIGSGLLTAFFYVMSGLVRLNEDHRLSLALASFPALAGLVAGFVAFLWQRTLLAYFVGMAGGLLIPFLLSLLLRPGLFGMSSGAGRARQLAAFIPSFLAIAGLSWLAGYGNTYIVELFFQTSDVARFSFAYMLASMLQLVSTALNQTWNPRFFALANAETSKQVERKSRLYFLLHAAVLGGLGAFLIVATPIATKLLGGNLAAYGQAQTATFFLFAAYAISLPWYHAQNHFLVHGAGGDIMKIVVISTLLGLACLPLAIAALGVTGIYVGFTIQAGARSAVAMLFARARWRLHLVLDASLLATLLMSAGLAVSLIAGPRI